MKRNKRTQLYESLRSEPASLLHQPAPSSCFVLSGICLIFKAGIRDFEGKQHDETLDGNYDRDTGFRDLTTGNREIMMSLTFWGAFREIFRKRVIFGKTPANYISPKR